MDLPRHDDGRHAFDFFHGRWQLRNERLKQRLVGSDDWEVFASTQACRPILDGFGNIDDFVTDWGRPDAGEPFIGMSLRLFNAATGEWSIYWAGNHDGVLEAPVIGRFENGVGTFTGTLQHDGRPVRAKFTWDQISDNAAHWHQAFSDDDGKTWETNWHMWMRRIDEHDRLVHDDAVIELRQYTMNPGKRDTLVELFEREFIEPQEAVGMHVIGHFRDLDDPDRYVWMRGFPSMPARRDALQSFYFGPVWQRHREAANATLLDNDNVLLLKPARPGSGFAPAAEPRAAIGSTATASTAFCAGICSLGAPAQDHFVDVFERTLAPLLKGTGATLLASYVTDPSANSFPRLPVREGELVFVWFARFDDTDALDRHLAALPDDTQWRKAIADALFGDLRQPPKLLRLAPTPRSELR
jgi:hypothetical protein